MFKKIIVIALLFCLCISLIACNKDQTEETKAPQFMNAKINETVIHDDSNVKLSIVSINWIENDGLDILFRVDDKNNVGLSLDIGEFININGAMMSPKRGQTDGDELRYYTISEDDMNMYGITNIYSISLQNILIYDRTAEKYIVEGVNFDIQTDMFKDKESPKINGVNIFKTEEYELSYLEAPWGTISSSPILCLTNKSQKDVSLVIEKVTIDSNEPIVPTLSTGVSWKNSTYCLNLIDYLSNQCGIDLSNAEKLSINITIRNVETGRFEYTYENYVIDLNKSDNFNAV